MGKKHRVLSVKTQQMESLILQDVAARLMAYEATGLDARHFEPNRLPTVPFEADAVIGGMRMHLTGRCKLDSDYQSVEIDFPDSVSEAEVQEWFNCCNSRFTEMLFNSLGE